MTADGLVLKPGQQIKASVSMDQARELVELRYGLSVQRIVELDAYDDRNYHVQCQPEEGNVHGYVLKIVNSLDSQKTGFVEAQNELLVFLGKRGIVCPTPVPQTDGAYYSVETLGKEGQRHVLRLLVFRPGEVLRKFGSSAELFKNVGLYTARLDETLKDFSHPGYDTQTSLWILPAVPKLRDFLFAVGDRSDVDLVEKIIVSFEQKVLTIINNLDKGIIHGDLNENNIIVNQNGQDIEAIIDFGDSHRSCFIFELAICLCYMITQSNSIEMAKYVIEGYQMVKELTRQEKSILKVCVCARFTQSLVLGLYSYQMEQNNQYLVRDHPVKWALLKKLWPMNEQEVMRIWGI